MLERRTTTQRLIDFSKINEVLLKHRLLWLGTMAICTVLGVTYAVTKQDQWQASQALIVRDEAFGEMGFGPTGRFDSNEALKRSLETILQIAKHREVVQAALEQVGPGKTTSKPWPREKVIESLQDEISVSAPKGTEFGTSDLIYLAVRAPTRERAVQLTEAVCDHLERRMQQLRAEHAQSIIAELSEKKELAEADLQAVTRVLSEMEQSFGSDLGDMRTLTEAGGGNGDLRSLVNQIKVELREVETVSETQSELLDLLKQAEADTALLVATPNQLLEAHPSLRRVKEGLVDAQLRIARLKGSMTEEHPAVRAAILNEENIRAQLAQEAQNAIAEVEAELVVSRKLAKSLRGKLADVQGKQDRLAGQRAEYANLVAKVDQRREQLRLTNVALAEARGRQEAARASSLITRLDAPTTSSRPVGPGRPVVILGSTLVGLLLGLSLVYLVAPWQEKRQVRGRRMTDAQGRRSADGVVPEPRLGAGSAVPQPLEFQPLKQVLVRANGAGSEADVAASLEHLSKIVQAKT